MKWRRAFLIYRWFVVCLALFIACSSVSFFVRESRASYHVARQLEREFDRVIRRWERAAGEPNEQPRAFRHWADASKLERWNAVNSVALMELQADQPGSLVIRYPEPGRAKCMAVDHVGRRWGWWAACEDVWATKLVKDRLVHALFWGVVALLLFRISPPDDDWDEEFEPWAPQPRWPDRNVRPVGGDRLPGRPRGARVELKATPTTRFGHVPMSPGAVIPFPACARPVRLTQCPP